MSECKWNFEFYENSVKLRFAKLSKKPSVYFQLYQLIFEQLFRKFMSVTIIYVCYSWQDFVSEMQLIEMENQSRN